MSSAGMTRGRRAARGRCRPSALAVHARWASARKPRRSGPGLHVVATPIGNLGDISLRALGTLAAADAILAEDTRVTKTLLAHYGISTPLVAYHEHNAEEMRPRCWRACGAAKRWRWCRTPARRWSPTPATSWWRPRSRGGHHRDRRARRLRRAGGAGGGGPADGPLLLRGLPAAAQRGAARAAWRR